MCGECATALPGEPGRPRRGCGHRVHGPPHPSGPSPRADPGTHRHRRQAGAPGTGPKIGADYALDPQAEEDKETVERLTRTGADLVFECAGTQEGFQLAYEAVRRAGTLCLFSWHKGERRVDLGRWHAYGLRVLNVSPTMAPDFLQLLAPSVACLWRGIFNLEPLVTHTAPLEDAQQLFETAARPHRAGGHPPAGFIKGAVLFS